MSGKSEDPDAKGVFISGVGRAFAILEDLAENGERSLSDMARRLDVNKNIAFRLVHTLVELGYLYEDPGSRKLRLTSRLSNVVRMQWLKDDVLSQAEPLLRDLARDTGELVRLAVVEGGHLRWVFAETGSRRLLRIDPAYTGDIIPHVHATSKAWLMTLDEARLAREIAQMSFEAFTPHTLTSADEFRDALAQARRQGYAMSYDERDLGVAAVAAPVLTGAAEERACAAVVSLSAPSSRMSRDQLHDLARSHVLEAARRLALFWPPPRAAPA